MIYSLQAGSEKECNISRVEYHAHMHLTCDSEMLQIKDNTRNPLVRLTVSRNFILNFHAKI